MNSLGSCNRLSLNNKTKQHVFDTYVSSVLDYGSEVLGGGILSADDVEKIHMDFCKKKRIFNEPRQMSQSNQNSERVFSALLAKYEYLKKIYNNNNLRTG